MPEVAPSLRSPTAIEVLLAGLLLSIFCGLTWTAQQRKSATYDEPIHLLAGQMIASGDGSLNFEHPPLVKRLYGWSGLLLGATLPGDTSRWSGQTREGWPSAHRYLYHNVVAHERLLRRARGVALTLSALLLLGIWIHARAAFGATGGLITLTFLCLAPNLIAHAALANLDVAVAGFLLLACGALWRSGESHDRRWLLAGGLALGAALATKHVALLAIPAIGLWLLLPRTGPSFPTALAWLALPALLVLGLSCGSLETLRWYGRGLHAFTQPTPRQAVFVQGEILRGGAWYYFIVALGAKLPLPLLLLGTTGLVVGLRTPRTRRALLLPTILSAVFLVAHSLTGAQYGVRYLLVVIPTLALGIGSLAIPGTEQRRARLGVLLIGAAWIGIDTARSWPDYLAHFNRPARHSGLQGEILSDSNLDWGQDLPALAGLLNTRNVERVYLAYFGSASPRAHGIDARALPAFGDFARPPDTLEPEGPAAKVLIAISISALQGMYVAPPDLYAWVRELPLVGRAGPSILVFDASTPAARAFIAATYWRSQRWGALARELGEAPSLPERLLILQAIRDTASYARAEGPLLLGTVLHQAGDQAGAEFELRQAVARPQVRTRALHELVLLYRRSGRMAEARARIRQALAGPISEQDRRRFLAHREAVGQ